MAPKKNPLKLNPLQLRTLTLFQELARYPEMSTRHEETGEVLLTRLPHAHGNHFHVGARVVMTKDAEAAALNETGTLPVPALAASAAGSADPVTAAD